MMPVITTILSLIEQFLPLLGTSAATSNLIGTIIQTLENVIPLVVDFAPTVYTSIKNIIIALKADPTTTQVQWDALDALDAKLDAANDAAIAAVDPDAT